MSKPVTSQKPVAAFLCFCLMTLPAVGLAKPVDGWLAWERGLRHECPSRHVDWLCDNCKMRLLDDYLGSIPPVAVDRIKAMADVNRRCVNDTGAIPCPTRMGLDAISKLGRMGELVNFSCRHYRCEGTSDCKRS